MRRLKRALCVVGVILAYLYLAAVAGADGALD